MRHVQAVRRIEAGNHTITCNAAVDESVHALGTVRFWSLRAVPQSVVVTWGDGTEETVAIRDVDSALRRGIWLGSLGLALVLRLIVKNRKRSP
ncbi:MAG: hypothetical protein IT198_01580 [Acidimicrobiia bacterium]|nr:hypothetical protein [Acidimicrobiia bacterium]